MNASLLVRTYIRFFAPKWTVGSLALLQASDGRICLAKHRGRVKPWGLPGGLIKWPESASEGLVRELQEELGLQLPAHDFQCLETLSSPKLPLLEILYKCRRIFSSDEIGKIKPCSPEVIELRWILSSEVEGFEMLERHRNILRSLEPGAPFEKVR